MKYFAAGFFFFAFDLALFWIFINKLGVDYIIATIVAFVIANSLNYVVNRFWGFRDTKVSHTRGYFLYMGVACLGLAIITLFMFILVQMFGVEFFIARVCVGTLVGIWNYVVNHLHTFKIPFLKRKNSSNI